ncbi:MAG: hypothetical protein ACFFA6_02290 [Promethearchaeota archaeon]
MKKKKSGYFYISTGVLLIVVAIFPMIYFKVFLDHSERYWTITDIFKLTIGTHTFISLLLSSIFFILGISQASNREESFISYGLFLCISILILLITYFLALELLIGNRDIAYVTPPLY